MPPTQDKKREAFDKRAAALRENLKKRKQAGTAKKKSQDSHVKDNDKS